ncbi:MAG: phage holin family protein [Bacteroidia bacterium]
MQKSSFAQIILKLLISGLAVFFTDWLLSGIDVTNFTNALLIAIVLAFLNTFLKPVLVLLTIPFTIFTLGLFLLVINAGIILLASKLIDGFIVDGFWWALLFSVILSITTSILEGLTKTKVKTY